MNNLKELDIMIDLAKNWSWKVRHSSYKSPGWHSKTLQMDVISLYDSTAKMI